MDKWVIQFYKEWGFYPMAGGTLGDGSSWDETNPQQSTLANTIDSYDRDIRVGVRGRMALEHEWPSSQSVTSAAGYHKFVTLQSQASKPTIAGTQLGAIYMKTVGSGLQEMFWENELGTEVQLTSRGNPLPNSGGVLQTTGTQSGAVLTGTTTMPHDDTTPQITEGDEYMTLAVTPNSTSNTLFITVGGAAASSAGGDFMSAALFLGTTANALTAVSEEFTNANGEHQFSLTHKMSPATTAAITFRLRVGNSAAGTTTINGIAGGRIFGGVYNLFMQIQEVKA